MNDTAPDEKSNRRNLHTLITKYGCACESQGYAKNAGATRAVIIHSRRREELLVEIDDALRDALADAGPKWTRRTEATPDDFKALFLCLEDGDVTSGSFENGMYLDSEREPINDVEWWQYVVWPAPPILPPEETL